MSSFESAGKALGLSREPAKDKVRVRIVAGSDMTEIRVSDARFNTVSLPANAGEVDVELPEGVYQVSFRDGTSWQSETVLLRRGAWGPVEVRQAAPGPLRSALPMEEPAPASGAAHVVPDVGLSEVTVFVRELPGPGPESGAGAGQPEAPSPEWLAGLSLVAGNDSPAAGSPLPGLERAAGLRWHVAPGRWRLHLDTGSGGQVLDMPLIVCPGWRTRVYLPLRSYGEARNRRADFCRACVRMLPALDDPFADSAAIRRLEVNALESLTQGRVLHGQRFNDLLRELLLGKYRNPMLGLYAGHLLPCANPDEVSLLEEVVANLTELTERGPDRNAAIAAPVEHPDVMALRLRLALLRDEPIRPTAAFSSPPMLTASWDVMLKAALRAPELVPAGSLTDRVAGRLWGPSAWVVWERPALPPAAGRVLESLDRGLEYEAGPLAATPPWQWRNIRLEVPWLPFEVRGGWLPPLSVPDSCAVIDTALCHRAIREWFRATTQLDGLERFLGQAIHPLAADEEMQRTLERLRLLRPPGVAGREGAASRPWTVERVATVLRVPASTAERTAGDLCARLVEQGWQHQLDLKARSPMARPDVIIPYAPDFLGDGFAVPLPVLTPPLRAAALDNGSVLDYTHFSLVMHAGRRVAIVAAHNIDAARLVRLPGGVAWRMDERAGENQLGPEAYGAGQADHCQLVPCQAVAWGSVGEARLAHQATFFYTNAAPQHQEFGQGAWASLEDWVLQQAPEFSYRLCVFGGPVLHDDDPTVGELPPDRRAAFNARETVEVPAAYWKVVVVRDAGAGGDDLSAVGFAMRQSEKWQDQDGGRLQLLKVHQVPLAVVARWTELDFGGLESVDELVGSAAAGGGEPNWPLIQGASDVVYSGAARRALGRRATRGAAAAGARRSAPGGARAEAGRRPAGGCACGGDDFDAKEAVAALGRDLARLTDAVAALGRAPAAGAARSALPGAEAAAPAEPGTPAQDEAATDAARRVDALASQAPLALRDQLRAFAEQVVLQADVARGRTPPPTPTELKKVVGGENVPPGGFPSCCCIGDATRWFCSGVVVAPNVVLTAAHCGSTISRVMVGGNQVTPALGAGARVVPVRRVAMHTDYRPGTHENDITVLILGAPAGVLPTPLATIEQLRGAKEVELVGFGYNDPQRPLGFGTKRRVTAPLGPIKLAATDDLGQLATFLGFHPDYEFVAGRKNLGRDTCNGDSGGPAYVRTATGFALAGLTSRATAEGTVNCGDGGIYVRPDRFRDWINGVLEAAGLGALPAAGGTAAGPPAALPAAGPRPAGPGQDRGHSEPSSPGRNTAMEAFETFRTRQLSLWQSAVEEAITQQPVVPRAATSGARAAEVPVTRAVEQNRAAVLAATALAAALDKGQPLTDPAPLLPSVERGLQPEETRGLVNTAWQCNKLAMQLAWARLSGDTHAIQRLSDELSFSNCDPLWAKAIERYLVYFKKDKGSIPYRSGGDYVSDVNLPDNATVAIFADWGTGTGAAIDLLGQIAGKKPDVVFHLGDIYYSGTQPEVQARFLDPCRAALGNIPLFSLSGNHDMYSGGGGYYWLVDQLGQRASYFCVRNGHWQFLAMDTGYNDFNPFTVASNVTSLTDQEAAWHQAKVQDGRARNLKTVLLSHHQLFSAYEAIGNGPVNNLLLSQFQGVLGDVAAWFWGHEHSLSIYDSYQGLKCGRCIGCASVPVFVDKDYYKPKFDVPLVVAPGTANQPVMLGDNGTLYNHAYAIMKLSGPTATVAYYQHTDENTPLYEEPIS